MDGSDQGAYRPQPSRRTYIPKADVVQVRLLAIAALEATRSYRAQLSAALRTPSRSATSAVSRMGSDLGEGLHDALDALVEGDQNKESELDT